MHNVIHEWLGGRGFGVKGVMSRLVFWSVWEQKKTKTSMRRGIVPIHHGCHMTLAQKISAALYDLIWNKLLKETNVYNTSCFVYCTYMFENNTVYNEICLLHCQCFIFYLCHLLFISTTMSVLQLLCTKYQVLVCDNALVNKFWFWFYFTINYWTYAAVPSYPEENPFFHSSPLSLRYRTGGAFKRGSGGAKTALNY